MVLANFVRAICGNDLTGINFDSPPTMGGVRSRKVTVDNSSSHVEGVNSYSSQPQTTVDNSSSHVEGVNSYSSQPQTIGSIGRPDCELEINARSKTR